MTPVSRPTLPHKRIAWLLIASCVAAYASESFDHVTWSFADTSNAGANQVIQMSGDSLVGVFKLVMGPGYWIVMGIGGISMLIGWFKGNKETIFMGLGLFIFAALIRGAIKTITGIT